MTQRLQRGRGAGYDRGHGFRQAVSKSTGLTVSDPAKASNHRRNAPSFTSLWDEAYIGSGENGKRYRRHHPASQPCFESAACRYLSLQFRTTIPARRTPIRLQQRCNLDSLSTVRTRFSIEFAIWRGRWRRPCVKYRFNSYTSRGLTAACRLYIQNEGLREIFWEDTNDAYVT